MAKEEEAQLKSPLLQRASGREQYKKVKRRKLSSLILLLFNLCDGCQYQYSDEDSFLRFVDHKIVYDEKQYLRW